MTEPAPPRRLYRSRTDRMLGGVAGGVAAYLQVDSALTRLVFGILVLAGGAGFLAYVIAYFVVPEEPLGTAPAGTPAADLSAARAEVDAAAGQAPALPAAVPAPPGRPRASGSRGARLVVGSILVVVGCLLLLDWVLPDMHHFFWPAAIIVFGLGFLVYGARR